MSEKQLHMFRGMEYTRTEYPAAKKTDSEFAKQATEVLGESYSTAQIREYRRSWGYEHGAPTRTSNAMVTELADAKSMLEEAVEYLVLEPETLESAKLAARIKEFLK